MLNRFLSVIQQIQKSTKKAFKSVLETMLNDPRSITSTNLRNILLKTDKTNVRELVPDDVDKMVYHSILENEKWI